MTRAEMRRAADALMWVTRSKHRMPAYYVAAKRFSVDREEIDITSPRWAWSKAYEAGVGNSEEASMLLTEAERWDINGL